MEASGSTWPQPEVPRKLIGPTRPALSGSAGLCRGKIVEAFLHASVYCGFPRTLNAVFVAQKVFGERDLLPLS